ncbi:DUF3667 domain-containing protein [Spirosoma sp. HMF4905]|uniref:DUF3667 domain-containing protein n=1 Tax=Spirosoma arboris TaxID=2682092 RepID=A0A7K1SR28_9BACT|nr:DUF3667 domain-containing protein [Spirosoma arboris]MVM36248.1 DUF3667 domain-containing protein [Spirosoma arboris]
MRTSSVTTHSPAHHQPSGPATCLNCGQATTSRFCPDCGQRTDTHRINWHYLGHDVLHSVWHLEGGILFTLKELLTRPGHSIREFLAGKRANHYRPLSLLLILGALLLFIMHTLDISFAQKSQEVFNPNVGSASERMKAFQAQVTHFVEAKQNLLHIAMIPLYAFWVWFMFRRRGFSYPEILVAQTFIANVQILISLLSVILFWAVGASTTLFTWTIGLSLVVYMAYNVVTYTQIYAGRIPPVKAVIRSIAAYLLGYFSFIFLVGLIGVSYGLFMASQEKAALKMPPVKSNARLEQPHR